MKIEWRADMTESEKADFDQYVKDSNECLKDRFQTCMAGVCTELSVSEGRKNPFEVAFFWCEHGFKTLETIDFRQNLLDRLDRDIEKEADIKLAADAFRAFADELDDLRSKLLFGEVPRSI